MFRAWVFTEMPYPHFPDDDTYESIRVSLPNRHYDPERGYQLYKTYFDLYKRADELGFDIMLNEHHATATCVEPAVPVTLGILARETKRARLLALGNPIANRSDPIRVAEEMAMIDVISQGRVDVGLVRGVPMEISAGNSNPVDMKARFWEAADLIVKAWTSHDGPFSWEGENYHHRQVNIWPRPYQEPHPPVWVPTQSASTAVETAERGYRMATILNGTKGCRQMFDAYRQRAIECGRPEPGPEMLAYLGLVFVGETRAEAMAGAAKLQWYLQNNKVAAQFMDVPGYIDARARAAMLESQARGEEVTSPVAHLAFASIDELTEDGYFFAGTPDDVVEQIERFHGAVGGFSNFLMMVQGGTMGFDLANRSMELFAQEVLPRVRKSLVPSGVGVTPALDRAGFDGELDRLRLP